MTNQTCTKCVLDTTDNFINFDENGVCNYCREYIDKERDFVLNKYDTHALERIVAKIKSSTPKGEYDCIAGVSGGMDSSYLLYMAIKLGLKPLVIHVDCGWNTEIANKNIQSLISKLNLNLYKYTVDWNEFKDIQLSYLKSGVLDLEIPTDHVFVAALYETAVKFNLKYILTGHNFVSESIMPHSWLYNKGDAMNMIDIHKKYGKIKKLQSFPVFTLWRKFYSYNIRRIENIYLLNYVNYNKEVVGKELFENLNWQPHPGKHGENIWTRYFQRYIMPRRFGIDIRKAHLSNLICSGQITRNAAMEELRKPQYDESLFKADKDFVLKRFGITEKEMEQFLQLPLRKHEDFRSELKVKKIYNSFRNMGKFTKALFRTSVQW
jgi:aminotransferase